MERLFEWDARLPASELPETPAIRDNLRHIRRAHPGRVGLDRDITRAESQQGIEQPADAHTTTGANIIGQPYLALPGRQLIGTHHIAHIGKITFSREIADP